MKKQGAKKSEKKPEKIVFGDGDVVDVKKLFRTINNHAPAKLLDELASIGDTLEQMAWNCGWKTDELYRTLEANGYKQNYMAVCFYVSATKLRYNRSQNTVKAWAMTARFYTPKVAKKYGNDILPFSTFTYAASWGETAAPMEIATEQLQYMWQAVLAYAMQKYHEGGDGRSPSVDHLKSVFEGRRERVSSETREIDNLVPNADTAADIDASSAGEKVFVRTFVQALRVVMNGLPKLSSRFPNASRVLSSISLQLAQLTENLERGEDYMYKPEIETYQRSNPVDNREAARQSHPVT